MKDVLLINAVLARIETNFDEQFFMIGFTQMFDGAVFVYGFSAN